MDAWGEDIVASVGGGEDTIYYFDISAFIASPSTFRGTTLAYYVTLNDPVEGIVWLARRLAEYGEAIRAGQVVLSGSFIRPVEAPAGSRFHADFGPFGEVSIRFA